MTDKHIHKLILPKEIIAELEVWKTECDKIKNSPLSYLKQHENIGTETNYYQTSVPTNLIESSYWLPFTLRHLEIATEIILLENGRVILMVMTYG